jgi:hypothetical protein
MSWGAVAGGAIVAGAGLISSEMQSNAAKKAAAAQAKGTSAALLEEQRQFDAQMQEYQRKQAQLEQQQGQVIKNLAPYVQGGQGAFYQMLALSGIAAPVGPSASPGINEQRRIAGVNLPSGVSAGDVAAEIGKGGLSLMSDKWDRIPEGTTSPRYLASQMVRATQAAHPDWTAQQINDQVAADLAQVPPESTLPTTENAMSPFAGMTGQEAQATAVKQIADSPLLQELTRQGEEAILQQASATGGLRGGNTQAVLAQFRPQMIQNEIDKQFARLGGLSAMGQSAISQNPAVGTAYSMPGNSNIGGYLSNLGTINAQGAQAQGQAAANSIGSIAQGIGYGLSQYNQPKTTTSPNTGQGGMQVTGFDAYGNPIYG